MPRQLRLQFEGALYHVMNRGDRREPIFYDDLDRECFISALAEACKKTGWQIHAYCLMKNHFHLVVETPQANLVAGMKWLLGTYTGRLNRRHKLAGHVFGGRYKSLIVGGGPHGYLRTVCEYVHLNPVRAKLLEPHLPLREYRWSSYCDYLRPSKQRPPWLRVDRLFGEMGLPRDSAAGRREFERRLEERRRAPTNDEWNGIRRGWFLGDDALRQELIGQMTERSGPNHYAQPRRESAVEQAERLVEQELQELGWDEHALRQRTKGDPGKVRIARRLRSETTLSLKWIADRLKMGSWNHVANRLYEKNLPLRDATGRRRKKEPRDRAPQPLPTQENVIVRTDPSAEALPLHCL
ncbi:MAG: transposase [Limisphaerales bacterium]